VFLKSLTIKGFKSFADPTTLEFEPGVMVVVGPNGSGKSNVVDAVAWVLGAQGPRSLRSTKMEEVIFAGTPKRAALGRAEVSLTIDNSAGLLPIDFSEVTITRTLFRSGESEYAINSVACRLLEIQELLSDTGVGRQQHVIVSQGNLDSILNSRPEERRLVIEEAAGILKYRRRKEKAERRLESTEAGLVRLQDLLREVRRQLRPLERQAEAARRQGDVVAELQKVRRYLLGRDLASAGSKLRAAERDHVSLRESEAATRRSLGSIDADVIAAETALDSALKGRSGPGPTELLARAEAAQARASGLAAVIAERRRSIQREMAMSVDSGVVASLEAEAAALRERLAETDTLAAALLPEADTLDEDEGVLVADESSLEARWGGTDTQMGPDPAAQTRAELAALRITVDRSATEAARVVERIGAVEHRLAAARSETEVADRRLAAERASVESLGSDVQHWRSVERERRLRLESAEESHRSAEADHNRWVARTEALETALNEARAKAGAQRLAQISGVLGALLDLVEVDEGWEAAFEAGAGEVLSGVIVDNPSTARRALAMLRSDNAAGAVVPLDLTIASGPQPGAYGVHAQAGARALRPHARARDAAVETLLDSVLAGVVVVDGGWEQAVDVAMQRPDLVVVTLQGDRFASGVWRAGAGGHAATGAALEEARHQVDAARDQSHLTLAAAGQARALAEEARRAVATAELAWESNTLAIRAGEEALRRCNEAVAVLDAEMVALREQSDEIETLRRQEDQRFERLELVLPDLERRAAVEAQAAAAERRERAELSQRALDVSARRRDLEVRAAGLEERRSLTRRRLHEVEQRLTGNLAAREQAAVRRASMERAAIVVEALGETIDGGLARLHQLVAVLHTASEEDSETKRSRAAHLEALRRNRSSLEKELTAILERAARIEVEEAECRLRLETTVEAIRRDLDCEPESIVNAPLPELPPGSSALSRRAELERELRLMGPINPLALEEHEALLERNRFLEEQLEDVRSARRELTKVIRAVDAEIAGLFQAAYADVADNFEKLFSTLFPGGQGRLRLTDPECPLETGIEIEARPSGKNLRRLSLLSGGERSLAAMAFLFAVFRSRPSPFYLLDEVEAALDDVNLHRFLDLVHEFRDEAQLLIVSHQKRTMEAADCLYGVTMAPGGTSRVVSERISEFGREPVRGRPSEDGIAVAATGR
jgi:chromosome segregation protein